MVALSVLSQNKTWVGEPVEEKEVMASSRGLLLLPLASLPRKMASDQRVRSLTDIAYSTNPLCLQLSGK